MSTFQWTKAADDALAWFWSKGTSTSGIAVQMATKFRCTFTKNMVIGRVHRLRLPKRPSPIRGHVTKVDFAPHKPKAKPKPKPKPIKLTVASETRVSAKTMTFHKNSTALFDDPQKMGREPSEVSGWRGHVDFRQAHKPSPLPIPGAKKNTARTCQWTECERAPWLFCDAPSVAGYSWCKAHKARVFTSVVALEQAA